MRRAPLIAICLLLGAITNVLITWGSVWLGRNARFVERVPAESAAWLLSVPDDWPEYPWWTSTSDRRFSTLRVTGWGRDGFLSNTSTNESTEDSTRRMEQMNLGSVQIWIMDTGFPLRSLRATRELRTQGFTRTKLNTGLWGFVSSGVLIGRAMNAPMTVLPLEPIPVPFAINTLSYGAIFWSLCLGVTTLRRRRRTTRGHCHSCNYDLAGLTTCPECGTATPKT